MSISLARRSRRLSERTKRQATKTLVLIPVLRTSGDFWPFWALLFKLRGSLDYFFPLASACGNSNFHAQQGPHVPSQRLSIRAKAGDRFDVFFFFKGEKCKTNALEDFLVLLCEVVFSNITKASRRLG